MAGFQVKVLVAVILGSVSLLSAQGNLGAWELVNGQWRYNPSAPARKTCNDPFVDVQNTITYEIRSRPIVMYHQVNCKFGGWAVGMLDAFPLVRGTDYIVKEYDENTEQGRALQCSLERMTGQRTSPYFFLCGRFEGGGDQAADMVRRNTIGDRIKQCS